MSDIAGEDFDNLMDVITTLTGKVEKLEVKIAFLERALADEIADFDFDQVDD